MLVKKRSWIKFKTRVRHRPNINKSACNKPMYSRVTLLPLLVGTFASAAMAVNLVDVCVNENKGLPPRAGTASFMMGCWEMHTSSCFFNFAAKKE